MSGVSLTYLKLSIYDQIIQDARSEQCPSYSLSTVKHKLSILLLGSLTMKYNSMEN